jgi:DNA polymerase-1
VVHGVVIARPGSSGDLPGAAPGDRVGLAVADGVGVGLAHGADVTVVATDHPWAIVAEVEADLAPRWTWWSKDTAMLLAAHGVRVARCWDLVAAHCILHAGWRASPGRLWAVATGADLATRPRLGQLGLLDLAAGGDGGDLEDPVQPDGHLRPEWADGGWAATPARLGRWAGLALEVADRQEAQLAAAPRATTTARSESAAELLCAELEVDGLPIDVEAFTALLVELIGPRPTTEAEAVELRARRDAEVLRHAPPGDTTDLRNPAQVQSLLRRLGIDVADTRAWRLRELAGTHPVVEPLLHWRKAERIATTYGWTWLDERVGADGRLRGGWTGTDGAAGRMTAQHGLHNLPAVLRSAVAAEPGHRLVRADLGQVEPRVLAAVSGDPALVQATADDDLYAPVAARLRVERDVAKVAVLAAMYGQTSGTAGQALRGLEAAYPVAMGLLADADRAGQAGRDLRTFGGRLVRLADTREWADPGAARRASAARGRYGRNAVIQGAAAELFKAWAATVRTRTAPLGARIVLCLHDELLVHAPEDRADEVAAAVDAAITEAAARWAPGSGVRFVADTRVIERWSEAK